MKKVCLSKSKLEGIVHISGAKNSALKLLVASLLTTEEILIKNFPSGLEDIRVHLDMFRVLKKEFVLGDKTIKIIEEDQVPGNDLEWQGRSIRNTLLILGALTSRTGYGKVPLPGGCEIGNRGYDLHQMVLEKLGANVIVEDGYISASAQGGLRGNEIILPIRSTGATENALLCACLARGKTRIWNPHIRPEILELVSLLKKMGANIEVRGQESIIIEGVEKLKGATISVMPDNVEALTFLIGSLITDGELEIIDFPFRDLEIPLIYLRESGAIFRRENNRLTVGGGRCYPLELSTGPYPGINSDLQPLLAVFGLCAQGESKIIDLRFPDRFDYLIELGKMGAQFKIENNIAQIKGSKLHGANVKAIDLRGGASLLLAGMVAEGETTIENFEQVLRGYEDIISKLRAIGARIKEL